MAIAVPVLQFKGGKQMLPPMGLNAGYLQLK